MIPRHHAAAAVMPGFPPEADSRAGSASGVRFLGLTLAFMVFLVPVVYSELSVNYGFVLLPCGWVLLTGGFRRVPRLFQGAVLVFSCIFFASFLGQIQLYGFTVRRTISFLLFLTYFSYVVVPLSAISVRAFKWAVVGIGLLYAVASAALFFSLGGAELHFGAKDMVGDQRFGFVYIMGAWIVYFSRARGLAAVTGKWLVITVLLGGVLLTFSRGAIVALVGSVVLFTMVYPLRWLTRPSVRGLWGAAGTLAVAVVLGVCLRVFLPTTFDFFGERLFQLDRTLSEATNPDASAGVRVEIAKAIVGYVSGHPLTGSGYLGVWILPDAPAETNSAHNQYTDVLFRTGFLGLAVYLYLLARLMRWLFRGQPALFWGMVATLIYCFFHDIFKESEGAFVLAFCFGLLAQALRERHPKLQAGAKGGPVIAWGEGRTGA